MERIKVNENFEIVLPEEIINKLNIVIDDILSVDYSDDNTATVSKKTTQ